MNGLFKVEHKYEYDNKEYIVYDIKEDDDKDPMFLLFIKGHWHYLSAENFKPVEDDGDEKD